MYSVVSRVDSFTAADLPLLETTGPAAASEPAPLVLPVRTARVVDHLTMMKALASRARLMAIELCLDGSAYTATALQTPMRMTARRAADHMRMLCRAGVVQARVGSDKRELEYFITPGFVRKAEDGSAIFDFGSGQLHFRHVRLPE